MKYNNNGTYSGRSKPNNNEVHKGAENCKDNGKVFTCKSRWAMV